MHSYKGSWGGGEGERGWGDLSIQFETCNKELVLKISQRASHFSWWALITRWSQKKRLHAGPWRGTRTSRSAWGSRAMALHVSLWTSSKYSGGDISGEVHNVSVANPLKPPALSQTSSKRHFPCHTPILNTVIHSRIMCSTAKWFYCNVQEVNKEGMSLLCSLPTRCPLTFFICVSVSVAFLFKASAFLGVGGKKEGRQQLFRKAASSVKFTKYHQHRWTNE